MYLLLEFTENVAYKPLKMQIIKNDIILFIPQL